MVLDLRCIEATGQRGNDLTALTTHTVAASRLVSRVTSRLRPSRVVLAESRFSP